MSNIFIPRKALQNPQGKTVGGGKHSPTTYITKKNIAKRKQDSL